MKTNGTNILTTEPDNQSVQPDAFYRENYHCSSAMLQTRSMIQSACLDLGDTNADPAEIAAQNGFADTRHFSQVFRARHEDLQKRCYR
jgi:AraC-like DNA-binding protein